MGIMDGAKQLLVRQGVKAKIKEIAQREGWPPSQVYAVIRAVDDGGDFQMFLYRDIPGQPPQYVRPLELSELI